MKRLLGGSDIKENCQLESCFDSKVSRIGKAPGCGVIAQSEVQWLHARRFWFKSGWHLHNPAGKPNCGIVTRPSSQRI